MRTIALNPPTFSKYILSFNSKGIFKLFLISSVMLTIALLIFSVFQVNKEVSERYLITKYEKELTGNLRENQKLEINFIEANSLDNITALVGTLNFEKIDKIHYIKVVSGQIGGQDTNQNQL